MNDSINTMENSILSVHNSDIDKDNNDSFDNLENSNSEHILIKLKSITNKIYEIKVNPITLISDNFPLIYKIMEINENDEIKLIFSGKLLKHSESFSSYGNNLLILLRNKIWTHNFIYDKREFNKK